MRAVTKEKPRLAVRVTRAAFGPFGAIHLYGCNLPPVPGMAGRYRLLRDVMWRPHQRGCFGFTD